MLGEHPMFLTARATPLLQSVYALYWQLHSEEV